MGSRKFTEADLAEFRSEILPDRPEGKSCRQVFRYKNQWEVVARAYNKRYPKNKKIPVLLGSEIVEQKEEQNGAVEHITRVVTVDIEAPYWVKKMLNQYDFKFNHKVTINHLEKKLSIRVTNISYEDKVTLIEDCMYTVHPENENWTHFEQTALLKLPNFPLSSVCEQYMIASYDRNTKAGRLLDMEFIQEVIDEGFKPTPFVPKSIPQTQTPNPAPNNQSTNAGTSNTAQTTPATPATPAPISSSGSPPVYILGRTPNTNSQWARLADQIGHVLQQVSSKVGIEPAGIIVVVIFGVISFVFMLIMGIDVPTSIFTTIAMQGVSLLGLKYRVRPNPNLSVSQAVPVSPTGALSSTSHEAESQRSLSQSSGTTKTPSDGATASSSDADYTLKAVMPGAVGPKSRTMSTSFNNVRVAGWIERLCAGKMQVMFLIVVRVEGNGAEASKPTGKEYTLLRTIKDLGGLYDLCKEAWKLNKKSRSIRLSTSNVNSLSSSKRALEPSSGEIGVTEDMIGLLQRASLNSTDVEGIQAELSSTDAVPDLLNGFFSSILSDEVIANSRFLDAFLSSDAEAPIAESFGQEGFPYMPNSNLPSNQVDIIVKKGQLILAQWKTAWKDVWVILTRDYLRVFQYRQKTPEIMIPLHGITSVSRVTGDLPFPGWHFIEIKTLVESFYFCNENQPWIIERILTITTEVSKLKRIRPAGNSVSSGTIPATLTSGLSSSSSSSSSLPSSSSSATATNNGPSTPSTQRSISSSSSGVSPSPSSTQGTPSNLSTTATLSSQTSLPNLPITPTNAAVNSMPPGSGIPTLSESYAERIAKKERVVLNRRKLLWDQHESRDANEVVEELLEKALSLYQDASAAGYDFWKDETFGTRFVSFVKAASELQIIRIRDRNKEQTISIDSGEPSQSETGGSERIPTGVSALAFYVNLYHVLVIHILLECGAPSGTAAGGYSIKTHMQRFSYEVDGLVLTPLDIEHQILRRSLAPPQLNSSFLGRKIGSYLARPRMNAVLSALPPVPAEPGISFILHCGANSSPSHRIIPVLTKADCTTQIAESAALYLQEHVVLSPERRLVQLPKVMEWYEQDFLTDGGMSESERENANTAISTSTTTTSSSSSSGSSAANKFLVRLCPYLPQEMQRVLNGMIAAAGGESIRIKYADYDWGFPAQFIHR